MQWHFQHTAGSKEDETGVSLSMPGWNKFAKKMRRCQKSVKPLKSNEFFFFKSFCSLYFVLLFFCILRLSFGVFFNRPSFRSFFFLTFRPMRRKGGMVFAMFLFAIPHYLKLVWKDLYISLVHRSSRDLLLIVRDINLNKADSNDYLEYPMVVQASLRRRPSYLP